MMDKAHSTGAQKRKIPEPPHPRERREPLPWQVPKATEEDPEALRRVQAILNSSSYRLAEEDSPSGLNISLPYEQYPNPYVTADLCFSFHYFALRKLHLLLRARALVAFPGYGTFDELFEVLTLVQTRKIKPIPAVLVGEGYWRRVVDIDYMVDEGVIDPEDRDLFWFAETAQEIWDGIQHWHKQSGEPLPSMR
jgi:uncharacterized protein (TIGR00730 family)